MGSESDKCVECVRLHRKCDLAFSAVEWKRVKTERDRLYRELVESHRKVNEANQAFTEANRLQQEAAARAQEALAKATRLQTQFQFLENKEQTMIEREFRNIAELEEDERRSSEPSLDDLLFDVSSERFKVPPGFD